MNNHLSTNNVIMIGILIRQQAFDKLGEENRNQLIGYIILLLLMIISKIQILQLFGHKMLNFFSEFSMVWALVESLQAQRQFQEYSQCTHS